MKQIPVKAHSRNRPEKPLDPILEQTIERLLEKHWPDMLAELLPDYGADDIQRLLETH